MKLPQNSYFICSHLGDNQQDVIDIAEFSVCHSATGRGLEDYLKKRALLDEKSNVMRTYMVRFKQTEECVGYFSLKAGLVSMNEEKTHQGVTFDTVPGVELANFAINNTFMQKYNVKGLGALLFSELIVPFVKKHSNTLGICMIYLFALPFDKLIKTCESYGFHRLPTAAEKKLHQRLKPTYDSSCIFMYQLLNEMR